MHLKTYFTTIFIMIFSSGLAGNFSSDMKNSSLSGRVTIEERGVPFATVYIKGTSTGTATDADGNFILANIQAGTHIVRVQGIGFKVLENTIEIGENENIEKIFVLEQDFLIMEQVVVSGSRVGALRYLPGSAGIVTSSDIKSISPLTGNEVLRSVTGLNVVDEEGAGLRGNIGVRGLDPDRSRNVLILEDGMPVALGPYGEPEMYYTPSIDRMNGVEVLKGSGSILYGPQTVGGVINYITADPPFQSSGFAGVNGGAGGHFTGRFWYGNTFGNTGFQINYLRRQAENLGPTEFCLNDFNSKIRFKASPRSNVMVKLGIYDENSNSTYVGLTQVMFDEGGYDFTRLAPDDNLAIRRYSVGVGHSFIANDKLQVNTTAYAYTTSRNWKRQDFSSDPHTSDLSGIVWGDTRLPGGAIFLRNSTGNRNRSFEVAGIEPRLRYGYELFGIGSSLDAGFRLLYERAYEQRVNGSTAHSGSGNLRDDEIRTGHAFSLWTQNKMVINERLSVTSGFRTEMLNYERNILRSNFNDVSIINNSSLTELIPGFGVNYNFSDQVGVFGGLHRGFAPPRIKDAISSSGENMELDAEKSWNLELGTRSDLFNDLVEFEMTFFLMDFSNQVIQVSESSGVRGTGYINGGRTSHRGIEGELIIHVPEMTYLPGELTAGFNSTITRSVFSDDRFFISKIANGGLNDTVLVNVKGNRTPYSPGFSANGFIQFETEGGLGFRIGGNYTAYQYSDVYNTKITDYWIALNEEDPGYNYLQATANGRIGMIPAFFVLNASVWYDLSPGLGFNLSVKNLLNERYISSRRPQGIRVGLPRMFSAGMTVSFR